MRLIGNCVLFVNKNTLVALFFEEKKKKENEERLSTEVDDNFQFYVEGC